MLDGEVAVLVIVATVLRTKQAAQIGEMLAGTSIGVAGLTENFI